MSPLSWRKNIHHVCGQNEITEQKDRNHAKVQAQGKPPIKIQIMAIFLKKNNFNSKLSHFQIKNILVKNLRKIFVKIFWRK